MTGGSIHRWTDREAERPADDAQPRGGAAGAHAVLSQRLLQTGATLARCGGHGRGALLQVRRCLCCEGGCTPRHTLTGLADCATIRLVNDGRDPVQDAEFALVLRDSAVRSQLPVDSALDGATRSWAAALGLTWSPDGVCCGNCFASICLCNNPAVRSHCRGERYEPQANCCAATLRACSRRTTRALSRSWAAATRTRGSRGPASSSVRQLTWDCRMDAWRSPPSDC